MLNKTFKLLGFTSFFLLPNIVLAHVGYVVDSESLQNNLGKDNTFLLSALMEPKNIFLILGTILGIFIVFILFRKVSFLRKFANQIVYRAEGYVKFLPWMIRLALGIMLIGAGIGGVLMSPLVANTTLFIQTLEVALGFMILSGFLLGPSIVVTIVLYLYALSGNAYIFGNADIFSLSIALLILKERAPGVDDLLGIPFFPNLHFLRKYLALVLRVGIGFAMVYLALFEKLLNPRISELVVEKFELTSAIAVSPSMWVLSVGIIELVVGLCMIFGFMTRLVAVIAFLILTVTFFYFGEEVYSHVTLFTSLAALLVVGGGALSIDRYLNKNA